MNITTMATPIEFLPPAFDEDTRIDVVEQLHRPSWNSISGLSFSPFADDVVPGQVLEETFWQAPDVARYFQPSESVEILNIKGPYESYTTYIKHWLMNISIQFASTQLLSHLGIFHPAWTHAWVNALGCHSTELNNMRYFLDLHMANIMYDESTGRITSILDWEFSGVVPIQLWDPSRAFLWNGQRNTGTAEEKQRLRNIFRERCLARGLEKLLEEPEYTSALQKTMQEGISYLRAIVEVCPRRQRQDKVGEWRAMLTACLDAFGLAI